MFRHDMDLYIRLSFYQRLRAYATGYILLSLASTLLLDLGKWMLSFVK